MTNNHDVPPRNEALDVAGNHIPAFLRSLARWCTWTLTPNYGGRPTKVPDQSTNNIARCRPWERIKDVPRTADGGVGFVFTGGVKYMGFHVLGVDIDACRDPLTREIEPWAITVVESLGWPYVEVSPSGKGLRAIVRVLTLPEGILSKVRLPFMAATNCGEKRPELQLFGLGPAGYVTMTGKEVVPPENFKPLPTIDNLDALVKLCHLNERPASKLTALPAGVGEPPTMAAIHKVVEATPKGRQLLEGDWQAVEGDKSASEAFHSLVRMVLQAANGHGSEAVDFLVECTAWGKGAIDNSADPEKYTRREWVAKDVLRAANKMPPSAADVFEALPPLAEAPAGDDPAEPQANRSGSVRLYSHKEFMARRAEQLFLVDGLLPRTASCSSSATPAAAKHRSR